MGAAAGARRGSLGEAVGSWTTVGSDMAASISPKRPSISFSFWKVIASIAVSQGSAGGGLRPQARAEAAFFFAYLRVKRSTRPAESISFCFPVKKGWQLEQISRRSSFLVERVVHVAPQAQWTLTTLYCGWNPAFMALPWP